MMFFAAQAAIDSDDVDRLRHFLIDDSQPGMNNPLARAGIA